MSQRFRVFVSSTTEDLQEYRHRVCEVIKNCGHKPLTMDDFQARAARPIDTCLAEVGGCDMYVGLVGFRYGDIPYGRTKSFIHLEYEAAKDIPRYVFLAQEKGWSLDRADPDRTRVDEFRRTLCEEETIKFFTTADDLASKVKEAILRRRQVRDVFDPLRCFLDRASEAELAKECLRGSEFTFTCIVGRGGYGKTALVSKVCSEMQDEIDGIVYLRCRGGPKPSLEQIFRDFGELLGNEAQQELLDVCNAPGFSVEDKTHLLIEKLGNRKYVYAFDNLEAIMDGDGVIVDREVCEFVEVLLTTTTSHNLKLIASSRVRPFVMPPATLTTRVIPLEKGLPEDDAISLLHKLDRDNSTGLQEADRGTLVEITKKCQCLPRALQLVFAVLQKHPASMSWRDLLNNDKLFGDEVIQNLLREHYQSLTEDESRVAEALAILEGPVTKEVIAGVVKRVFPSINVSDSLDRLWRCGTVTRMKNGSLALQALDQQYVVGQIRRRGDSDDFGLISWHGHAADYYKEASKPPEQRKSQEDIQPVLEEIRHRTLAQDFAEAAELIDTIDDAHLFPWGHFRTLVSIREPLVGKIKEPKHIQQNLGRLGNVYRLLGKRDEAISRLNEAIQIAECKGYGEGQSEWLAYLGHAHADSAHFVEAYAAYEKGIAVAKAAGAKRNEAESVGGMAILCRQTGKIEKAIEYYEQALVLDKELKDDRLLCKHTGNLACAYVALGDCEKAKCLFEEALGMAKKLGFNQALAFDHFDMSRACLQLEEFEEAKSHCKESLKTCETTGEKRCIAYTLNGLGQVVHHQGNLQEAKGYYEQALELEMPEVSHKAAANLGIVALAQGDSQKAAGLFEKAVGHCEKLIKDFPLFYEAVYHRAAAELGLGAASTALKTLKSALDICGAKGVLKEASQYLQLLERAKPDLAGLRDAFQMLQAAADQPRAENR